MSFFWRFLLALASGFILALGIFVGLLYTQLGVPTVSSSWAYGITQGKLEIAHRITGPKLILVGGSATLFGLDAEIIQRETGIPTVNLGTHAGIGLDYILDLAKRAAQPGDTVLLIPEYQLYADPFGSELRDDYILSRAPEFFHRLSWYDKIDMATRVPFKRFQKGWRNRRHPEKAPRPHPPYTDGAASLNANGDETENQAADRPAWGPNMDLLPPCLTDGLDTDDTPGFRALADFIAWAKARQITVLATFPPMINHPEYRNFPALQTFTTITDFYRAHQVPMIGTPEENLLPAADFFDTFYHLTRESAVAHTEHFIPELKPDLRAR